MKQKPILQTIWIALVIGLCTVSLLSAGEYEPPFGRHVTRRRGETHARLTADMLILGRSNSAPSVTILTSDPAGGPETPLLNTTDLELDASFSGRYDLIFTDDSPYELQFTLTGFPNSHRAQASRADDDIRAKLFGLTFVSVAVGEPTDPSGTFAVTYDSKFGSGEVNLRRRLGQRVTWLSGFRYIALQEDIDFVSEQTTERIVHTPANVDNALYGFQIGAESTVWTNGKARVDVIGRGGVFLNHVEAELSTAVEAPDPSDPNIFTHHQKQSDIAAFAGDLQAVLIIPLGSGSLRLGYQAFLCKQGGATS